MTTRMNININEETAKALKAEAAIADTTITEIVRRAVSVYEYAARAQREGHELQLQERSGDTIRLVLL